MTILFPLITTMPMLCFSCADTSSTASSNTRFMKGSNPRKTPVTCRPPFSFNDSLLSMYFFNSGGWVLLMVDSSDFPTLFHLLSSSRERRERSSTFLSRQFSWFAICLCNGRYVVLLSSYLWSLIRFVTFLCCFILGMNVYDNLPFRRKNAKRNNVCYQVLHRSFYGLLGSSLRRDLKIIRSLVQREGSKFCEVWCKNTKYPVGFDSQHLFFDKFRTCYTSFGFDGKPDLLYKLSACENSRKTESALVFESPVDQHSYLNCTESKGCKPCLIAVTADGWLIRHDLNTGDVLQKVYLSKHYRFKHILWESDLQRIVLKSVHFSSQSRPLMFLSIFSVAPLEFIALMPIEKSIFGQDIVDAAASNGFLVVMHHSNRIRFYNLWEIMENYSFSTKLGKTCRAPPSDNVHQETYSSSLDGSGNDPFIVGEQPHGLPVNVSFTSKPAVLFEICSNKHVISFGGYPWHYISCPQSCSSSFHVRSVKDLKLAKSGILEMDMLSVEPDQAFFHADNSGRILHIGAHEIKCLKLCQVESKTSTFELSNCFALNLKNEKNCTETVKFTSSGREIKARKDQEFNNPGFETVLDVDYEDELDVLVVLSSNDSGDTTCGVIGLYDNQTGTLIHESTLSNWKQDADHSIMMEKDTIVHIMKDCSRKFCCTVYRLSP